MSGTPDPRPDALSRRGFLGLASAAVGLWFRGAWADSGPLSELEGQHLPVLRVPRFTRNGAKVPIVVEMAHPMTPDHHITSVHVANDGDPISSKGTFHFTPDNGRVYLAFQARMHEGVSEVTATAECSRHGKWCGRATIEIPVGAGGCTGTTTPAVSRTKGEDIRPPIIRIPELVERGVIRRGEIIHPQVKMRHPNRTGLVFRGGRFVQESEPIHLDAIEVVYGGVRVSRFDVTSALSDDPLVGFALLARHEGPLRVVVTNSRGQELEAIQEIHLS